MRTPRTRVLGGSGRYRRAQVVRRREGRPGRRDPSTGMFTLNFAGVLRY